MSRQDRVTLHFVGCLVTAGMAPKNIRHHKRNFEQRYRDNFGLKSFPFPFYLTRQTTQTAPRSDNVVPVFFLVFQNENLWHFDVGCHTVKSN